MTGSDLYYMLKPIIPRGLQIAARGMLARRTRKRVAQIWPIDERSGSPPPDWKGWPEGKQFAFILTHDVDTSRGLERCCALMELEERLGFRSAFYFVAEDYRIPTGLFQHMKARGFETGVHGLTHTGNPFSSAPRWRRQAQEINLHLKRWGAVGFRSPSMYHNLEWIGHLDIEYDLSTFDTDPFEPQPKGLGTIFPVWVQGKDGRPGYLELPYTLPQDFTLFALMRERSIRIWKDKLRWVAQKGGMALVIVHPDYLNWGEGERGPDEYPVQYYLDFLNHVRHTYAGMYWNALPHHVARFYATHYGHTGIEQF